MAFEYFTEAELRATPDMADDVKYPDAKLSAAHDWVVGIIERRVRTSFVARTHLETVDGDSQDDDGGLLLSTRFVQDVTAVVSNGVAFTAPQLAEIQADDSRIYRRAAGTFTGFIPWDAGTRNIEITDIAGYSTTPPSDVKDAALQGARDRVLRTSGAGISDRTTSISNDTGTILLGQPGQNRPTGLPEVDVVIEGWREKLAPRFGFA